MLCFIPKLTVRRMFPLNMKSWCSFFLSVRLQTCSVALFLRYLTQIALLVRFKILTCEMRQNKDGYGGLVISSSKSWCYMKVLTKICMSS